MEPFEIGTVKDGAFEMEYLRFGTGTRALVILPGISVVSVLRSAGSVAEGFARFAKGYTVYLFDRAKTLENGYTVAEMAEDTARAMRSLGILDADVFGASQGGMIAQVLACRYPELTRRMVLASTMARTNPTADRTFPEWVALARSGDRRALNRAVFEKVYSAAYRETWRAAFDALEDTGTPEELRRFAILSAACLGHDLFRETGKILCPVLAVGARDDRVLSGEATVELAAALNCPSHLYEGYGHAAYDEAPDFRDRMYAFFAAETV